MSDEHDIVKEDEKRKRLKRYDKPSEGKRLITVHTSISTVEMVDRIVAKLRKMGIATDRSKAVEWCMQNAIMDYYYYMLKMAGKELDLAKERRDEVISVEEKLKKMNKKFGIYTEYWVC